MPHKLDRADAEWADVVVTMGCGDECPFIPGRRYLDWELDDPAGRRSSRCGGCATRSGAGWRRWQPSCRPTAGPRSRADACRGQAGDRALVLAAAVTLAGLAYPVTNAALRFSNPALIATVRALAGGLIMLPVLRALGARLPRSGREWAWATAIGAGNVTLTLIGISEGTRLSGAAAASVLVNSAPFFAALMGRIAAGRADHRPAREPAWWSGSPASC